MFGILLLYWIGKYYYKLAEEYDKNKWGFTALGIVVYYGFIILSSFIFGIIMEIVSPGYVESMNEAIIGLMMLPFGIIACTLYYNYLANKWRKEAPVNEMDNIGASVNEN